MEADGSQKVRLTNRPWLVPSLLGVSPKSLRKGDGECQSPLLDTDSWRWPP